MSDHSARLSLPLIAPAQAQKHVTHNEALAVLDALVQTGVVAFDLAAPPVGAVDGSLYVVADAPTGEWAGQADNLAFMQNGGWMFIAPQDGWRAWDSGTARLMVFSAGAWIPLSGGTDRVDGIGINTDWDTTNRIAVDSQAALFTNSAGGHQIKVNKAADTDTASVLFQSGFTGHAEMGLAGDTAFSVKVSADGATWTEALKIEPVSATISGAAVQQAPDDVTTGRLMRADWGYSAGNVLGPVAMTGGVPTGGVIERGENANGSFVKFADGTLICQAELAIDVTSVAAQIFTFPHPFSPNDRGRICTSFSHIYGFPDPALYLKNFRVMGHTGTGWLIDLETAGVGGDSHPDSEKMSAMAIGRWA